MIRIQRPAAIPAVLLNEGVEARQALCAIFDADPTAFARGTATFTFDRDIYGSKEVKDALLKAQHKKCCFCEAKVTHISDGDVEHFRPKRAFRQRPNGPLRRPGYYWLAYEWTNLFFCCEICNRRYKANLFPLRDGRRRVRSRDGNPANEDALFVKPDEEDPAEHIQFRQEFAHPVPNSDKGQPTIDALGLNREDLVEDRRTYLDLILAIAKAHQRVSAVIQQARTAGDTPLAKDLADFAHYDTLLTKAVTDSAEYAAMVRAAL